MPRRAQARQTTMCGEHGLRAGHRLRLTVETPGLRGGAFQQRRGRRRRRDARREGSRGDRDAFQRRRTAWKSDLDARALFFFVHRGRFRRLGDVYTRLVLDGLEPS
jgi:hypothetical protein